jgi:hypothetical protein
MDVVANKQMAIGTDFLQGYHRQWTGWQN